MKRTTRTTRPFGALWWPQGCPRPGRRGWDELPWPATVPVLVADDIAQQQVFPLGRPPYNLEGWHDAVFEGYTLADEGRLRVAYVATIAVESVIRARTGKVLAAWEYHYHRGVTRADAASAWNEGMALLGYDVTRPTVKKSRRPAPAPVAGMGYSYDEFFS